MSLEGMQDHLAHLRTGSMDSVPKVLQVGDRAPDFELPGTGGKEVKLSEAVKAHRATVVAFYVLDFTPG